MATATSLPLPPPRTSSAPGPQLARQRVVCDPVRVRSRVALVTVVVLALAGMVAVPADASVIKRGGWRYVTKSYGSSKPGNKTLTAECPDGTHVYGGGHYNDKSFGSLIASHSFPFDSNDRGKKPDDGWRTRVTIAEELTPSAYAICAKPRPTYKELDFNASAMLQRQDVAMVCPDGAGPAISGGTDGPASVREVESSHGSLFTQWDVAVENRAGSDTVATMFLVCSDDLALSVFSSSDSAVSQTQEGDTTDCAGLTAYPIAGGQENNGAAQGDIVAAASRPVNFAVVAPGSPGGWQTFVDNHHTSAIGFTTEVVCAEKVA